jgi:hypothetical protein
MNAFVEIGARQISAPAKARQRATEKRARKAAQKALAERDDLFRLWKHKRREDLAAALSGAHGESFRHLVEFLDAMTLQSAAELVEHVRAGGWDAADRDTRFRVLDLVGNAIIRLRERHDLPPFDDPLPRADEPPNAFLILREWLS